MFSSSLVSTLSGPSKTFSPFFLPKIFHQSFFFFLKVRRADWFSDVLPFLQEMDGIAIRRLGVRVIRVMEHGFKANETVISNGINYTVYIGTAGRAFRFHFFLFFFLTLPLTEQFLSVIPRSMWFINRCVL